MATSPTYAPNTWTGRKFAIPENNALPADPQTSALLKIGFGLLLLDTFLTASRFLEIVTLNSGFSLPYVATTIHACTFGFAFVTGGVRRIAATRTGIFLILFTAWMLICTPLSTWRTGSVQTILNFWTPSLVAFFICGLLSSVRQCRRLASVLAFSGLTIAVASFFLARQEQRFAFHAGTLSNANDLAMLLLLAAPFFLIPLLDPASHGLIKLPALAAGLLVIGVSFRTSSRAGFLALLAMLGVLFLTRSVTGKLKVAGAVVALAAMIVAFIPAHSLSRYATIFNDYSAEDARSEETYGSSEIRKELLQESLMATLEHPVFGVGPGVYAPAMAKEASLQGRSAQWRVSHNTYTQVSAEMGIPGLILYLAMIVCGYWDILWVRRHSRKDSSQDALALGVLLSMVGLTVNFLFSSNAYMAWLLIPIGLSAALRFNVQRNLDPQAGAKGLTTGASAAVKPAVPPIPPASAGQAHATRPVPTKAYTYRFLGRPRRPR